jgi:hypothetical protein
MIYKKLTSLNRIFPEKLTVAQIINNFQQGAGENIWTYERER